MGGKQSNFRSTDEQLRLIRACETGREEIVREIIATNSALLNERLDAVGNTALILASQGGRVSVVRFLLGLSEVDVNKADGVGWTALHWAASRCHLEVVTELLAHPNIDPSVEDVSKKSAKDVCGVSGQSQSGRKEKIVSLVEEKIKIVAEEKKKIEGK